MFGKWRWILPQAIALILACPQLCGAADSTAVPRLPQAPKLEDFANMRPSGAAAKMLRVSDFIQNFPSDGKPSTERSEGYLGYDQTNLYIVLLCWDQGHSVRANLTRREPPTTNKTVAHSTPMTTSKSRSTRFKTAVTASCSM